MILALQLRQKLFRWRFRQRKSNAVIALDGPEFTYAADCELTGFENYAMLQDKTPGERTGGKHEGNNHAEQTPHLETTTPESAKTRNNVKKVFIQGNVPICMGAYNPAAP
jgi:hypothetical protein